MKITFLPIFLFLTTLLSSQQVVSQQKPSGVGSEELTVVKPFTPTITDATKLPFIPLVTDPEVASKEKVTYSILSFPVASTFTPKKGTAQGVEPLPIEHHFANSATLGIGNFGTINAELYAQKQLSKSSYFGGFLKHLSSQGGIKEALLKNNFHDTSLEVAYVNDGDKLGYNVNIGFQNQGYNWYGLPDAFGASLSQVDRTNLIEGISPQHNYTTLYLSGKIAAKGDFYKAANFTLSRFSDSYLSAENSFLIAPIFEFSAFENKIKMDFLFNYLSGSFATNFQQIIPLGINYGFTTLGFSPSYAIEKNDWDINLGVSLFYNSNTENKKSKFYMYPNVRASYKIVKDLVVFYTGATGILQQNTYQDFVSQNPYVSPTLLIQPTEQQYELYAGLKGKITTTASYSVKASYSNERNRAFFISNDFTENPSNQSYAFGNSFSVVYDTLKTLSLFGEAKADFSENLSVGIHGSFSTYTNNFLAEAWNLPSVTAAFTADYQFTDKWSASTSIFYVGSRKDFQNNLDIMANSAPITLDAYLDANVQLRYQHNKQFSGYIKANNIANQAYQKWLNYPVQSLQIMLGANYAFDF